MTVDQLIAQLRRLPGQAEVRNCDGMPLDRIVRRVTPSSVWLDPIGKAVGRKPKPKHRRTRLVSQHVWRAIETGNRTPNEPTP